MSTKHKAIDPLISNTLRLEDLERMSAHLRAIEQGTAPRYSAEERQTFATAAKATLVQGTADALSRDNMLARDMASSMATIDGRGGDNPFEGSSLERIYRNAQHWHQYVQEREKPAVALQDLLNQRAVLIDRVEGTATDMHEMQRHELAAFCATGASLSHEHYQTTLARSAQAVAGYNEALRMLREFRHRPTDNPQLQKALQEVEALELVVTKTEQGIRNIQQAGIAPSADDWADLRNVKLSLKAYLQANNATLPVRNDPSVNALRDGPDSTAKVAPRASAPRN